MGPLCNLDKTDVHDKHQIDNTYEAECVLRNTLPGHGVDETFPQIELGHSRV